MKISVEEALEIVEKITNSGGLSKVQEIIFSQCWEGHSYQKIAKSSGYQLGYIRDVGHKLWQSLSKAFGEKITKTNFQRVIKQRYLIEHHIGSSAKNFTVEWQLSPTSASNVSTPQKSIVQSQDWGEVMDLSMFFGRVAELAILDQWMVHDRCRVVSLYGMPGIGKTSLAAFCAEQIQHEFEYIIWRSLRNA